MSFHLASAFPGWHTLAVQQTAPVPSLCAVEKTGNTELGLSLGESSLYSEDISQVLCLFLALCWAQCGETSHKKMLVNVPVLKVLS